MPRPSPKPMHRQRRIISPETLTKPAVTPALLAVPQAQAKAQAQTLIQNPLPPAAAAAAAMAVKAVATVHHEGLHYRRRMHSSFAFGKDACASPQSATAVEDREGCHSPPKVPYPSPCILYIMVGGCAPVLNWHSNCKAFGSATVVRERVLWAFITCCKCLAVPLTCRAVGVHVRQSWFIHYATIHTLTQSRID